ncbi:MAG TPA: hypothetical protein V6C76_16535 [Drouetiella sp.]
MSSAFRTFMSAAGVGSACYLLASAKSEQVLMLFLAASLGWCLFAYIGAKRKTLYPTVTKATKQQIVANYVAPPRTPEVVQRIEEPPRKVYKFPIHELAGNKVPRPAPAFEPL